MAKNVNYRVKYWRWINEQAGEWYRTGLMTKGVAEKVAESLRQSHEQVKVYRDDDDIARTALVEARKRAAKHKEQRTCTR